MNRPDLSNSKVIALDIETYDPELKEMGTGVYRKDGYILGVSINNGPVLSKESLQSLLQ